MKFKLIENNQSKNNDLELEESRADLQPLNPNRPKDWAKIRAQNGLPDYQDYRDHMHKIYTANKRPENKDKTQDQNNNIGNKND